jgi:hypothetical protein
MKSKNKRVGWWVIFLMTATFSGCQLPVVIEEGALTNWFWSRFGWATLVSAAIGAFAAIFLCRLPIRAPLLDCIQAARAHFIRLVLLLGVFVAPLILWLDAVMSQPFGEGNQLSPWSVFLLVTLDWRTLIIMLSVAVTFYLSVALFTRTIFGRTCSCKYAFIPKARS